jgi:NCS1 nucleoside transporter family
MHYASIKPAVTGASSPPSAVSLDALRAWAWQRLGRHPDEERPLRGHMSTGRVALVWLAGNLVVTTQLTGTLFVPGVSWTTALGLIAAATAAGVLVLVLVGNIGTRSGLSTMTLARASFGPRGAMLPVTANLVVLMGWSWVQAMLGGLALAAAMPPGTPLASPALCAVLCQAVVVFLTLFGHEAIERVEPWLALLMCGLIAWIAVVAFGSFPLDAFTSLAAKPELGWSRVLVAEVVLATAISWTVLSADINRLAGSQRAGIVGSSIGYFTSTFLAMAVGATAMAYLILRGDSPAPFDPGELVNAFGIPVAVVIVLSVIATNTLVLYGMIATTLGCSVGTRLHFLPVTLVLGAISVGGSTLFGLLARFTDFLAMIGTVFVPLFAIMLADYYLLRRAAAGAEHWDPARGGSGILAGVGVPAVATWILAAALSLFLGYGIDSPVGTTLPTFVTAFLLYLVLARPINAQ